MNVLIVFLHPAPYKIKIFNELSKLCNLYVLFERKAKNRNKLFYNNKINFKYSFIKGVNIGKENIISNGIKNYLKKHAKEYDRIVINGYSSFAEMKALNFLKKNKIPYIFMINGGIIHHDNFIKEKIKRHFISGASKYLYSTNDGLNYLLKYGASNNKCFFYHYSNISSEKKVCQCPITNPFNNNKPLFISIGQFIDRKNNHQLIKIFKDLPYNLILIGEGKYRNSYIRYIKKYKIHNICIINYLQETDLISYYNLTNYYISLSKEDIFGHTIIEALNYNVPVIASDHISVAKDIIKDGINGYLVDIRNNQQIIDSINRIVLLDKGNISTMTSKYNSSQSAKDIYNIIL